MAASGEDIFSELGDCTGFMWVSLVDPVGIRELDAQRFKRSSDVTDGRRIMRGPLDRLPFRPVLIAYVRRVASKLPVGFPLDCINSVVFEC